MENTLNFNRNVLTYTSKRKRLQLFGKVLGFHVSNPLSEHAENKETLRIWRNGRVQSVPKDYYDEFIINRAKKLNGKRKTNEFFKAARLCMDND